MDPRSNSLIIHNYTRTESGGYYCQLSNDFGVVNATRTVVSITDTPAPPYTSPLEDRPTPHNLPTNITTPLTLSCTGLNLQSNNITVQWFKDYTLLSSQTDDNLTLSSVPPQSSDAGYYCCTVSYLDQQINHHCITVWVRGEGVCTVWVRGEGACTVWVGGEGVCTVWWEVRFYYRYGGIPCPPLYEL